MSDSTDFHRRLIQGLLQPTAWPASVTVIHPIETHISTVLLTGDYAYKIKKPVDLGFLDFSSLARRKHFCEEEIRLNRRLAPQIYLDVVPITGTTSKPHMGGTGPIIEYAVRMRQFEPTALLSSHPDLLTVERMDQLARIVASFHGRIAVADPDQPFGTIPAIFAPMEENFAQARKLVDRADDQQRLDQLEQWSRAQLESLQDLLTKRRTGGFIRECHGDMHLGNIALMDDEILIFDGLEFAPALRWIDTMSEIAFLIMDLQEKGRADLAQRFLNSYLAITGDYEGLILLWFYQLYRAMVRAKVDLIRLQQPGLSSANQAAVQVDYRAYLTLAEGYTRQTAPSLIITHGLSGSGKSTVVMSLLGALSAIQLRSDIERKRLAGLTADSDSGSGLHQGVYSPQMTEDTYRRLKELAAIVIKAGFVAVVDATFLKRSYRQPFHALAQQMDVPFLILDFQLPEALLRQRIDQRLAEGDDPSEAHQEVLDAQLIAQEPLTASEQVLSIQITPEENDWAAEILCRQHTSAR
ncbi:MAG: AAA family ATPase [Candidatus Polarisedimenticolaceae bacterium]|nr:AAA family ATPase [Candidatus Polarisedimenticolaceae bacterium]